MTLSNISAEITGWIHSRNHKVSSCCDMVLRYHKKIRPLIAFFHCSYHQP